MAEEGKKNIQEQILEGGHVSPDVRVEKSTQESKPLVSEKEKTDETIGAEGTAIVSPVKKTDDISEKTNEEKIEEILEEDLEGMYFDMSDEKQDEFKKQGEETVRAISLLMRETTVKVKRILKLITKWLKVIPGINKFFLEQEAKIKTDKILKLKK